MGETTIEQVWAGWRLPYIQSSPDERSAEIPAGKTLFEGIEQSGLPDHVTYITWRGEHCFALLNAYPYTSGHVMVLPKRGVAELELLDPAEFAELWQGVRMAVVSLKESLGCQGVNVGINLGEASGAGVPDHLHVHCVPRWRGDTNFMATTANTRVIPEALGDTWRKLRDNWPATRDVPEPGWPGSLDTPR